MRRSYFWVYMLECENGAYYTGYTTNLVRRFRQHVDGSAQVRYTRTYRPVRIAQCWRLYEPMGSALKVERLIKASGRAVKDRLVRDPARLKDVAAAKLGNVIRVFPFDPAEVERVSRNLDANDIRGIPDPFVSLPPAAGATLLRR